MKKELFDKINDKEVYKFSLTNGKISAEILNLGGIIRSIKVPDKKGNLTDVVLGYNNATDYLNNDGYLGAIIGRYANRIGNAKFSLNGKTYNLYKNDGNNTLHGGKDGFDKKIFDYEIDGESLILSTKSSDGEENFPSNLELKVKYSITKENGLKIEYFAESDNDTVLNLTNHSYFNLNGEGKGDILSTEVQIFADEITPVNEELICENGFLPVKDTPFDFNLYKEIGKDIEKEDKLLKICKGYDINYVLKGTGFRKVASAFNDVSGIKMDVLTDREGVQFYTGNFLSGQKGKSGIYEFRNGFCFETQHYPNALNCDKYPSPILKKGEKFYSTTEYRFY